MRTCTAHFAVYMPALLAGESTWSKVRTSIDALSINDQPRGL